jgi:hypothetical protein
MAPDARVARSTSPAALAAGAGAGIVGGILMAMFMMMYAAMALGSMWAPLRMLGATFYGPEALVGGAGVMLWGLMVHMMASAGLGALFAALIGARASGGAALGWGVAYGLAVLVGMTFLVLPWANPTMFARVQLIVGAWIIGHIVFGMGVALAPALMRRAAEPRFA